MSVGIKVASSAIKTTSGESISAGVWTLVGIAVVAAFGAIGVWLKTRSGYRQVEQDGEEKLRSEMWRDIEALKQAKETTSRRLTLAETKLVEQSVELGQLRFIMRMVIDELDRVDPGNPMAKRARDIIMDMQRDAMPSAEEVGPMAEVLSRLCIQDEPREGKKP